MHVDDLPAPLPLEQDLPYLGSLLGRGTIGLAIWKSALPRSRRGPAGIRRVADIGTPAGPDGVAPFHANVREDISWNAVAEESLAG